MATTAGAPPENSLRQVCWSFVTFRRPFDWRSLAFCRPARADARPAFADLCGNQPVSEVILRHIAETSVHLHAIEPTRSREQRRVDGV